MLLTSIDKAIWNWIEAYPDEYIEILKHPNEELSSSCDQLFDSLDSLVDNKKGRSIIWPLQIILLILLPVINAFLFTYKNY